MTAPTSTYRVQLGADLRFADLIARLPYYDALGIGCLYLSPITTARPGSTHGYDVADPTRLDPRLGTLADFRALATTARAHGIGLLIDIVPNHMAASICNPWWADVLRHGQASRHATWFDIDWDPPWPEASDRILLPMLGERYGEALRGGHLTVAYQPPHGFVLCYHEHRIPLDPATCVDWLTAGTAALAADHGAGDPLVQALRAAEAGLRALPPRTAEARAERADAARSVQDGLDRLAATPAGRAYLDAAAARLDPTCLDPDRGDPTALALTQLDALLAAQPWRLAYWKIAGSEANYRRFFDVNELVGVCVERSEVREATHALTLELADAHLIDGVRVDHIDGLADPAAYLHWLRERLGPDAWVIVEKILERNETLPPWPVDGTTGYDFLAAATGVFVDPAGLPPLEATYAAFTGRDRPYEALALDKQRDIIDLAFRADIRRLAARLACLARRDIDARDVAESELSRVLLELTAALPVYRTYINPDSPPDRAAAALTPAAPDATAVLDAAFATARARDPRTDDAAYAFVRRVIDLDIPPPLRAEASDFIRRWQQLTPPVRAKGIEDTSLYIYNRLLALNDVGAEPSLEDITLADFHHFAARRRAQWPDAMNATSTHDTKRSEDVRARLDLLSEHPKTWARCLARWSAINAPLRTTLDGKPAPDPNEEILLYQTLLGAWPLDEADLPTFRDRLRGYLIKAAREAREFTSWNAPDPAWEDTLCHFAETLLDPTHAFREDFHPLQLTIARQGAQVALAQQLLKLTAPGIPDIYQGTELWDFSLVDPDNRRPVDHNRRVELLARLDAQDPHTAAREALAEWHDGRIKLLITRAVLHHRRAHPQLYARGDYVPLYLDGPHRRHVCAYARCHHGHWVIIAVPRLTTHFTSADDASASAPVTHPWTDAALALPTDAPPNWRNVFTGERATAESHPTHRRLPATDLFRTLPVALFEAMPTAGT